MHRHGFEYIVYLLHESTFGSFASERTCFVTDVLSHNFPSLQSLFDGSRLPPEFILHLTKDVLKGLEHLHNECRFVHSGMFYTPFTVIIGQPDYLKDLKPDNILL